MPENRVAALWPVPGLAGSLTIKSWFTSRHQAEGAPDGNVVNIVNHKDEGG